MRSRSLGIIFFAAVIVPSILLAVLSIRSASREEAWMEKQMAVTLDAEVTHTAALAGAEVTRVVADLRAALDVPPGSDYARQLTRWKGATALIDVPFMLSPRYGILWPPSDARADSEQKRFLEENGSFLSDRTATTVLQNIAVRYQNEILAESSLVQNSVAQSSLAQKSLEQDKTRARDVDASVARKEQAQVESALSAAPASSPVRASAAPPAGEYAPPEARQMALDAFAQNADIQTRVYEEAREKGDQLNARVVQPLTVAGASAPTAAAPAGAAPAAAVPAGAAAGTAAADEEAAGKVFAGAAGGRKDETAKPAPTVKKTAVAAKEQPSQFVLTSQLLSQIASQGDSGLIPRFIGEKLVFLFWARQKDGRIAGCELASSAFRGRIAGVLTSTWSPVRILTLLDENGAPLAVPPDVAGRDWRRPFVAREITESLPRWEAAAYLTRPDSITAQARTSSLVIWIMVVILFVSVAGGGTMVLSSVYGEMKLAQQKATFVANVSHELKTPLTSLSLFIDLLRRKRPLPQSKKEQYLSLMASETERLTRLINNDLDISRDTAARRYAMRKVDAAEVTAQIVESQRVRLESRGFSVSTAPVGQGTPASVAAPLAVHADPEALKQVLLNLLSNAEKYSAKRKEIVVTVLRREESVFITVRDRGIGIPEKDRERVFREFYRVDDSLSSGVQGTGLGLTIARRIARDHGGEITCAPRDGGGTDFVVRLPAGDEGEAPA
ncbi:MAG: sensor histidine kinase [Spirochaetia bacterium]